MQYQKLLNLAKSICEEINVMCYDNLSGDDLEKMLLLIGTWIESFYYIDPSKCLKEFNCVLNVLEMHGEVFRLAIRGEYIIDIDEELFREAVKKLAQVSQIL
uniref:Uncharacterized protein n=1 Tax=Ignisphaera aggregans TaxID=334771 RepID=A0A7C5YT76_9CREN